MLTFFAEDASTHTLLYANADLAKTSCNREVIAFADPWHQVTGHDPALLIFDSKLTTQAVLAELDDRGIGVCPATPQPLRTPSSALPVHRGIILNHRSEIVVRPNRRTYSPVLRQARFPKAITVPWWEGRTLRHEYA